MYLYLTNTDKEASVPRLKFKVGDHVRANEKAPMDYAGREGIVIEVARAQTTRRQLQYGVQFTREPRKANTGHFDSWMLDTSP